METRMFLCFHVNLSTKTYINQLGYMGSVTVQRLFQIFGPQIVNSSILRRVEWRSKGIERIKREHKRRADKTLFKFFILLKVVP